MRVGCVCVHMGECSYVYEYLCLYCVSKKKLDLGKCEGDCLVKSTLLEGTFVLSIYCTHFH
jgi:hypothetical protein